MPNPTTPKRAYSVLVAQTVFAAAVKAVKEAMTRCSKLAGLQQQTLCGAQCNEWADLRRVKLVVRAKLSCLTEFKGDFNQPVTCSCGHTDTFLHAAGDGGCGQYQQLRDEHPHRWKDDNELLAFTEKLLRLRHDSG